MLPQTIFIGEPTGLYRDNDKFTVILNHWSGNVIIPVTETQARALVTAAQEENQILDRQPTQAGKASCKFKPGNQLTAVMNETGHPDTLISMVPYDKATWLAWVAGDGATFQILASDVAHRILSSARSQASRTQPTFIHHGRSRYLFIQPNSFAAGLRPKTETQGNGRVDTKDATFNQLSQRFTGAWRNAAL